MPAERTLDKKQNRVADFPLRRRGRETHQTSEPENHLRSHCYGDSSSVTLTKPVNPETGNSETENRENDFQGEKKNLRKNRKKQRKRRQLSFVSASLSHSNGFERNHDPVLRPRLSFEMHRSSLLYLCFSFVYRQAPVSFQRLWALPSMNFDHATLMNPNGMTVARTIKGIRYREPPNFFGVSKTQLWKADARTASFSCGIPFRRTCVSRKKVSRVENSIPFMAFTNIMLPSPSSRDG
ncbi:hypothetical protein ACLOJK_002863 [Asimina triloba]